MRRAASAAALRAAALGAAALQLIGAGDLDAMVHRLDRHRRLRGARLFRRRRQRDGRLRPLHELLALDPNVLRLRRILRLRRLLRTWHGNLRWTSNDRLTI